MNLLWIDAILPVPNVLRSMETLSGVYAAASIHQAEELLHTHRIDLCLISNRMPQGDPLSLFPPGAEDGPVLAVIGHGDDLAFLQRAMERDCCGYLTFPLSDAALQSLVARMISRVRQKSAAHFWYENLPMMQNAFWQALVDRRLPAEERALSAAAQKYAVELPPQVMPVFFRCRKPKDASDHWDLLPALLGSTVFAPLRVQAAELDRQTVLLLLFGPELSFEAASSGCKQLLAACTGKGPDTVCILGEFCSARRCRNAARMAQAGRQQMYLDNRLLPAPPVR